MTPELYSPLRVEALAHVENVPQPETLMELKRTVIRFAVDTLGDTYGKDNPPEYLMHIGQVAAVTQALLAHQTEEVQLQGQLLAWSHDIGRSEHMGKYHPVLGALMLRSMNMDSRLVSFALSHHRWGLGERSMANGNNFPGQVREALASDTLDSLIRTSIDQCGVNVFAVTLADNSKEPPANGDFEPIIAVFDASLKNWLIQAQIHRGRYEAGSYTHGIEETGATFLLATVPVLEERLGVSYRDSIDAAREQFISDRVEIVVLWNEVWEEASQQKVAAAVA